MESTDKIKRFLAYEGRVNVVCCSSTNLVEKAKNTHDLSPVATAAFGRLLTITAIMASEMKNENDKITIQMKGNGPIGGMLTVANNFLKIKGYVVNRVVDLPLNEDGKLDVGKAIGYDGYLNVVKDIGLKDPYIGMVPIISGEVAEDFANYFVKSEQKQTAVALGVLVDKNGVKASGGYIVTPMPDVTEEDIYNLEKNIFAAGAISKMLDQNLSLEDIAKKITGDENIKTLEDNITPVYECDCSKEKMARGLMTIGKEELSNLTQEKGSVETVCQFCNSKYQFTKEELEKILEQIK